MQHTGCPFATISIPPSFVHKSAPTTATAALVIVSWVVVVRMTHNMVFKSIVIRKVIATVADISVGFTAHVFISGFVVFISWCGCSVRFVYFFSPSKFKCLGTPFGANSIVVLGLLELWTFFLRLGINLFVSFIGHFLHLRVFCVHLFLFLIRFILVIFYFERINRADRDLSLRCMSDQSHPFHTDPCGNLRYAPASG